MKTKLDYNKKYTIFDRVKFEQLNWTGYNADLLDELVEAGNSLVEDNAKLTERKNYLETLEHSYASTTIRNWLIGIGIFIFCIGGLATCIVKDENIYTGLANAYKLGQVDVLTNERVLYESSVHGYVLKKEYQVQRGDRAAMYFIPIPVGDTLYNIIPERGE